MCKGARLGHQVSSGGVDPAAAEKIPASMMENKEIIFGLADGGIKKITHPHLLLKAQLWAGVLKDTNKGNNNLFLYIFLVLLRVSIKNPLV